MKTVFTNGCFDILHRGHLEYLKESAYWGNRLIVGINFVKFCEAGSNMVPATSQKIAPIRKR